MAIEQSGPGAVSSNYGTRSVNTPVQMSGAGVLRQFYDGFKFDGFSAEEIEALKSQVASYGTVTISTSAGQTVKIGAGYLKSFTVIAKGTSPTLTVYDNTTNSGTLLFPALNGSGGVGDFPALDIGETYVWEEALAFNNGCHVVIGGTGTTTIQFQFK